MDTEAGATGELGVERLAQCRTRGRGDPVDAPAVARRVRSGAYLGGLAIDTPLGVTGPPVAGAVIAAFGLVAVLAARTAATRYP